MNRIETTFQSLKAQQKAALITFIMAGDPQMETSLELLKALPQSGADIIELGMPFTDPAADGLTIQRAGQRALAAGMNLRGTLDMVREFRHNNQTTPIILMGYANPIFAYGFEKFAEDAAQSGVDGLIIVDLPPEEDTDFRHDTQKHGIEMIRLITPTTDADRLPLVLNGAGGFLYYVSITGVTGAAKANLEAIGPHIQQIKQSTKLPVAVGFGIKTPNDAQEMSGLADAVVVGSGIIEKLVESQKDKGGIQPVLEYVQSLSASLERSPAS